MTIQTETREVVHNGNDVATSFSFSFKVASASELRVTTTIDDVDEVLVLDTDYSVTLNADQNASPGGSITYPISGTPLATGDTLQIDGNDELLQEEDLQTGAGINPQALEEMVDRLTRQVQQLQRQIKRTPRMPNTQSALDAFTRAQMQQGYFIGVDENGRFSIMSGTGTATDFQNVTWAAGPSGSQDMTLDAFADTMWVNPRRFGAVADGVTDDTVAIQAAIDYALENGKGVYCDAGVWAFTNITVDVSDGSSRGPLIIRGDAASYVQFRTQGTIFKQLSSATGDAFNFTGDWYAGDANGSDSVLSLHLRDFGLYSSSASTGWGMDLFNVTGFHSDISNVVVYTPNANAAGGVRLRSCWCVTINNLRCDGPNSGTTSKGLVIYGTEGENGAVGTNGTTNQILLNNINCVYYGKANVQIGKHDESGGGTTQGVVWNVGQAGTSPAGYGVVIGRAFDYTITGVHTENNSKSGWLFTESANGAGNGWGKLTQCDSFDDAEDGASDSDGDSYSVQFRRGSMIMLDGFRFQSTKRGIYVADTVDASDIELDRVQFGGKSNNTDSRTALYIANTSATVTKRITLGHFDFSYSWGNGGTNVFENPSCISYKRRSDANAQSTGVATTETVYPWTEQIALAPTSVGVNGTADNGSGLVRVTTNGAHGLTTGDVVRVWNVKGTIEANGFWVVTRVDDTNVDLQGSTYTTAYGNSTYDRLGKVYELTDITAVSNYYIAANQTVAVKFNSSNRLLRDVANGGNFYLKDGRDVVPDDGDVFVFVRRSTVWYEQTRNRNRLYLANTAGIDHLHTVRDYGTSTSVKVDNYTQEVVLSQSGATNVNTLSAIGTLSSGGQAVAFNSAPTQGQVVVIRSTNGNSTLKDASGGGSAKFRLAGGADLTLGNRDTIAVKLVSDEWHQVGYSNN